MSTRLTDPAEIEFLRRMRLALLLATRVAGEAGPSGGWVKGFVLRDQAIDPETMSPGLTGKNDLALKLLRELVIKELIVERLAPDRPLRVGERFTLGHCDFRVTSLGMRLLAQQVPADPDVWDDRMEVHQ